jgi:hypothetical protein
VQKRVKDHVNNLSGQLFLKMISLLEEFPISKINLRNTVDQGLNNERDDKVIREKLQKEQISHIKHQMKNIRTNL